MLHVTLAGNQGEEADLAADSTLTALGKRKQKGAASLVSADSVLTADPSMVKPDACPLAATSASCSKTGAAALDSASVLSVSGEVRLPFTDGVRLRGTGRVPKLSGEDREPALAGCDREAALTG